MEKIDEVRKLNSRRQFKIKKGGKNSKSKDKTLKSPSDFTNVGGKSVVSLISTQSGKTNHSAPLGPLSNTLGESPTYKSKFGKQNHNNNLSSGIKLKKKIRPSSSLSPGNSYKIS